MNNKATTILIIDDDCDDILLIKEDFQEIKEGKYLNLLSKQSIGWDGFSFA
jgi:hypothetical protein